MMRKGAILYLLLILLFMEGKGQSIPMYSQYMYNMTNINPAYAGNRGVPSLAFLWREQWAGMPGAPSTKSISYDLPINDKKVGIGFQLFDDRYASVIRRTGFNLMYNLKFPVSDNGVLSMGLKAGFYNDTKLLTDLDIVGATRAYDIAFASNFNKIIPLAGAGVYYNDDKFYIGFSAPDVIVFSKVANYASEKSLYQVNEIHYYLASGYSFTLNEDVSVKPSILIKASSGAPIQADFNTSIWLKNIIGLGASYRSSESVLGMCELQVSPQLRFGYAYDMPFVRPNSNELFLRLEFGSLFPNTKSYKIF